MREVPKALLGSFLRTHNMLSDPTPLHTLLSLQASKEAEIHLFVIIL